ncbi:MAG: flavodoxin family protein [Sedimentisphaerales bacterium]
MNILGISGSPREKGNTAYAVKFALEILKKKGFKTKYISLSGKVIRPCRACFKCGKTYSCFQKDDMEGIIDAMKWCDGLIIGSPVYLGMVSGQLKTMMDRCVVMRPNYGNSLPMSGKIGAAIACGNWRNGGQELTLQNIQTFFLQMNMLVIGDGPNYSHCGAAIVGQAKKDLLGLKTVKNVAHNLAAMLKK